MDNLVKSELNTITENQLNRVKRKTPVGDSPDGATLRERWDRSGVNKAGSNYIAEVFNPMEYASHVEYGHKQKVGRLVFIELRRNSVKYGRKARKQKDGRYGIWVRLTKPYVKGVFMLTKSEVIAEKEILKASNRVDKIIKDIIEGGE